jgi:hypothetical protein
MAKPWEGEGALAQVTRNSRDIAHNKRRPWVALTFPRLRRGPLPLPQAGEGLFWRLTLD